jgi:RNA polymerase sigma factor (sigma-70 family)
VPTQDGAGSAADSDQALVARVRRGDDRAFEVLYQRYHRRIHAYVLGMVKDHGRAEDVTQEVFLSALRRMRETEQPLAFKPWLYQIAKNSCIDAFRRSKRAEEVSYDADEGLAPADHSRLVSSGLSPDAAVDAKQNLDSLCGAFGGLSETHHEILVLRELEGLSYQEIGRRMGMSRPAVESTLFRARRRLSEEFDDIVSGARCLRIQGIIVNAAAETRLGARDTRRLARHLSHCQPCRREALAAGLDRGLFTRPPMRERVAARVAAFLPLPAFLRTHLPAFSDQMSSGWGKAATGAAVLVAGVGAGVGVQHVATPPEQPPAAVRTAPPAAPRDSGAVTPVRSSVPSTTAAERDSADSSKGRSGEKRREGSRRSKGAEQPPAAGRATSDGGGAAPASAVSGGGASEPAGGGVKLPAATKPARKRAETTLPKLTSPVGTRDPVERTGEAVKKTTEGVKDTTQQVTGEVDKTVQEVTGSGPVSEAVTETTGTVNKAVETVTKTVDDATSTVTGTGNQVTGGG